MPHEMFHPFAAPEIELEDVVIHGDSMPSVHEVLDSHNGDEDTLTIELPDDMEVVETTSELEDSEDLPEGTDLVVMHEDHETGKSEAVAAIDFGDLPGAPHSPEPEHIEVEEDSSDSSSSSNSADSSNKSDSNDLNKKKDKWDWKAVGFGQFTVWVKERFDSVPKHSGYDLSGLERAHSYLERLHSEISKAMRADLDGELEADMIAGIHEKIEEGLEKLEGRIEKVKKSKDSRKKKSDYQENNLVKEAQKIFGVQSGVVITVPLFISSVARTLVNGMVSGGHDIEHMYVKLCKKFKLDDREKMELIQLLQDMGLPMIKDRGLMPEEGFDPSSSDNFDYGSNYKA